MDLIITKDKVAIWKDHHFPISLGPEGIGVKEREGDGVTPLGVWPIRRVFYRGDRVAIPETPFPTAQIHPTDGWCDDPRDPLYNRYIKKPYGASHEDLWRSDHLYDVVVVLGYNDDPIIPGKGSAIFMHLARENFPPTQGCIGFRLEDLLLILRGASLTTQVVVKGC